MFFESLNQLFTACSELVSTLAFELRKSRTLPISTSSCTCEIACFCSNSDIFFSKLTPQDHRRVKSRVSSMLGFKRFFNARRAGS